ncbi:hypothetical protein JTB14_002689 [Gonioctena quinquepunctata]|nr:hypothetical protein JTB14_002689 [Gonioctena quinquepunctata]
MKCVLLLSLVALCYSVPLTPVSPTVNFGDDGTITIIGVDGRKAVVSRADKSKNVEILLTTPQGFKKLVKVDEEKSIRTINVQGPTAENWNGDEEIQKYGNILRRKSLSGKSEYDILEEIFGGRQGILDSTTIENVLNELKLYVASGELDPYFYEILESSLENNPATLERLNLEQGDVTPRQVDYYQRLPLLQYYWNKKAAEQQRPVGAGYGNEYGIGPISGEVQGPLYRSYNPYVYSLQQLRDSLAQKQEAQQQYQELIQPQQQLIQSQLNRNLPWNQEEKQWVEPQQYSYGQQRPSLDQYLAQRQLAQAVPWSRISQQPQQYYGSQIVPQALQLSQRYQQLTPSGLGLYEPYEQQIGIAQEDVTQRGQASPWNRNQIYQTYFPKENIWQRYATPMQLRQQEYSLNVPVVPIARNNAF